MPAARYHDGRLSYSCDRLASDAMSMPIANPTRHWPHREGRFLGMVALTVLTIGLYLDQGLRLATREGAGHRAIDTRALQRRIDAGELRDREAQWYHRTRPDEGPGANRDPSP
jgi:hypothetical protein